MQAVLIDDDALIRMGWEFRARQAGVALVALSSAAEFQQHQPAIPTETPIFIDYKLGAGPGGEAVARDLYAQGYRELYLVTGYPPDSLPVMPWLRGIRGKLPPF